ncbi:MAG: hypothetical protein DI536_02445 [Archangium gephyra]|uniref:YihY/virulence factor BrkB family protein n=1 Tax=Archangium gephyra TaxID=48 RepID=A0A2W5TSM1_9BACT|nr:MAG: hypothetical protein DI536_02445 [Archangium gephyra]
MFGVLKQVLQRLYERVILGPVLDQAAQLGFYAVLALAPFLLVLTSLGALVPEASTVFELLGRARLFLPDEAYELIASVVKDLLERRSGNFLTFGLVVALWSASRAANSLRGTLNSQHGLVDGRPWLRQQAVAIGITVGGAVLLLVSAGVLLLGSNLTADLAGAVGVSETARGGIWSVIRWPVVGGCLTVLAAISFRTLPDIKSKFWPTVGGAVVTALIFIAATQILVFYAKLVSGFGPTYGALAGGVALLLWCWLSSIAFVVGGEVVATFPARPRKTTKMRVVTNVPAAESRSTHLSDAQ